MEANQALQIVKQQLSKDRYQHTVRVANTAVALAERFNCQVREVELAAIFHDYAKERSKAELETIIKNNDFDQQLLLYHNELWHAPVGAYLVEKEVGLKNQNILKAIKYHTTGRPEMSKLEKIVYLADYIEPARNFPGINEVRDLSKENLDEAVFLAVKKTITFLISKDRLVYPDTFATYNDFLFKRGL